MHVRDLDFDLGFVLDGLSKMSKTANLRVGLAFSALEGRKILPLTSAEGYQQGFRFNVSEKEHQANTKELSVRL